MKYKLIIAVALAIVLSFILNVSAFAIPELSPETRRLCEEAGLEFDVPLEEIMRRQEEYNRKKAMKSEGESSQTPAYGQPGQKTTVSAPGAIFSYDELHIGGRNTAPNDGYGSGGFDELHVNENYRQNVYHPEHRGFRMEGFDEFRYVDEM